MSRNHRKKRQYAGRDVTSREGRVSRNKGHRRGVDIFGVTSREGRVSRNSIVFAIISSLYSHVP